MRNDNELMNPKELYWLVISFNLGSAILILPGILANTAGKDAWLSLIIGLMLAMIPITLITKLSNLYPQMSFVQYSEKILGKIFGKILGLLWCWFIMHLGGVVFKNFQFFFNVELLPNTPAIIIYLVMSVPVIMVLYLGINTFGLLAQLVTPLILSFFVLITLNMVPVFNFDRLLPLFQEDAKSIFWGGLQVLSFPFAETVIFASLLPALNTKKRHNSWSLLTWGLVTASVLLMIGLIRTILALGIDDTQRIYYAVLEPSRREAFDFLRGLEIFIILNWFNFAFFKITICLYSFCTEFSRLFGTGNYRLYIIPAITVMISLAEMTANNIVGQVRSAAYFWPAYALPIQIFIPAVLLIIALIRKRLLKVQ